MTEWKLLISKCFLIPQRYILAFMGFLGVVNAYLMRVVLSVAITEMVAVPIGNHSEVVIETTCPGQSPEADFNPYVNSEYLYDWSERIQGLVLSSFYWGYIVTHIPGGMLAEKWGGKHVLGVGILSTAIFTLVTPWVVKVGNWHGLILLRVLVGFGEGITFPALNVLLSKWTPPSERSTLGTLVYAGAQMGTVIGNSASGLIISYAKSWESVFYIFGAVAIIWYLLWLILCYSEPHLHPFISTQEKEYLEKELANTSYYKKDVPWKAILTSLPLWALVVAELGHDWGLYIMITDLPKYMKNVLKFNVKQSGIWSSLPYLIMWFFSMFCAWYCDFLIARKYIHITTTRKIFAAIASIFPGIFLLTASYMGCNQTLTVVMFCIGMGFMGAYYCGIKMNALDLSTDYAGTIMAIVNGVGALSGIVAPYLVGVLIEDNSLTQWRTVFWITFAVFVLTMMFYGAFGSAETQTFNVDGADGSSRKDENIDLEENGKTTKEDYRNQNITI